MPDPNTTLTPPEAEAAFVNEAGEYYVRLSPSSGPVNLAFQKGTTVVIADTSGGAFPINLPDISSGNTKSRIIIGNIGANDLTINPAGSASINGFGSQVISLKYYGIVLRRSGANWIVVRKITPS